MVDEAVQPVQNPPQGNLQLELSASDQPLPAYFVHKFAVRPTYARIAASRDPETFPVTITLAQYSPAGTPTLAVAIQAERDILVALVKNLDGEFIKSVRGNATLDPARLRLSDADFAELKSLPPERWFHSHLLAARAATSLTGSELEWVEGSAMALKAALDANGRIAAKPSFRTPMTSACLYGMFFDCKAALQTYSGEKFTGSM